MGIDEFVAGLNAQPVGKVEQDGREWRWTCDCADTGLAPDESTAAMALYFHRRSGHQHDVVVSTIKNVTVGEE